MNFSKEPGQTVSFKIPSVMPVFPLPNVLLFPGVELPLYIFEPRYREMLKDCLSGRKFIAISLLKQGWETESEPAPSYDTVGVGYVRAVVENPDGTFHVLLKGLGRAKIVRYLKMEPYRVAKVKPLQDEIQDAQELSRLASRVRRLLVQKIRFVSENPHARLKLPKEFKNPVSLSYIASFLSEANPYLKQSLLETTNTHSRLKHLVGLLGKEIYPPSSRN